MLAFHNDKRIKQKYVNRIKSHIKADTLVRGTGWEDGKGCAVGCTLEQYNHKAYETELGIPEWLARVEDALFEGMGGKKSKTWPLVFLKAIKPGVDLEKAKATFLIVVLKSSLKSFDHKTSPAVKQSVESIISLWKRKDIGSIAWKNAAYAAADAAYAAAYVAHAAYADAASNAAYAAANAAYATADAANDAAYAARYAAYATADAHAAAYATHAAASSTKAVKRYDYFADQLVKILKGLS